ncbi:hypothetical protein [Microbacterium sp. CIAB417]|uniref:hypothetical protein n=1 Tax=Microbacterium sp. CIAB417 TaxID=2860287 RepID=UPI001FAB548B|nr:hypothetical protein [Microbacterium sp. CIAB417]
MSEDARENASDPGAAFGLADRIHLTRRQLFGAAAVGVIGAQLLLDAAPASAVADTDLVLAGTGFSIRADGGRVTLLDAAGTQVQRFTGYRSGVLNLTTGTSALGTAPDGTPALIVTWDVPPNAPAGSSVRGTFTPRGRSLEIVYDVNLPGATTMSTGMMRREPVPAGTVTETFHGPADWVRDPRGGIPYQDGARTMFVQERGDTALSIVAPGANSGWRDNGAVHLPASPVSAGVFRATARVVLGPADERPAIVEAIASRRALAVELSTDRPFNIWETAAEPLIVHAHVYNGAPGREVMFTWVAHDFDGRVIAEKTHRAAVGAGSTITEDLGVSLPGRGIAFVELTVTAGDDAAYERTNIAVLPPHEFSDAPSFFGLSADYLRGPVAERELIRRLGLRRSRHAHFTAEELATYGFTQHRLRTPASIDEFDGDPIALAGYVSSELDLAEKAQATHYECANEWNMRGGVRKGVGAEKYVTKWATAFREEIDRRGSKMRFIPVALAGMDDVYARKMFEAGLADRAHAFNLHPGRGNFTPDYAPTPSEWATGDGGSYWNYYGALTEARRQIDEYAGGDMEFWLTEAYTPTKPNSWWHDTYRHAAENTLLTAALAPTKGVDVMQWFQFYDNVKASPVGADPDNPEYHYGLLLRDLSPKPHLLALANAAEHLDGARFLRWLDLPDEARGLLFDTPRGELVVLWSRADGYLLNTAGTRDGSFFPAEEPWVDTWETKTAFGFGATATVKEIDAIGRARTLTPKDGRVTITLDGAPRLYYGLDIGSDPAASAPGTTTLRASASSDGSIALRIDVRNGAQATAVRLHENGRPLPLEILAVRSSGKQKSTIVLRGRAAGAYTYTGEVMNAHGSTVTTRARVRIP